MSGEQDRDALAEVIYLASEEYDFNGVGWQHQFASPKEEALAQADAILASDWLADHDRRVRASALRKAAEAPWRPRGTARFLNDLADRIEAKP